MCSVGEFEFIITILISTFPHISGILCSYSECWFPFGIFFKGKEKKCRNFKKCPMSNYVYVKEVCGTFNSYICDQIPYHYYEFIYSFPLSRVSSVLGHEAGTQDAKMKVMSPLTK